MGKRSSGEGSVFRSKNGRWVAIIELPRKGDGKRRRKLRRARTKAEAQAILRSMQDELRRSGTVAAANRTIAEAVETFRSGKPPSPNDDWMFGLILAGLGAQKVSKLTVAECDDFLTECAVGTYGRRPIGIDHLRRVRQRLAGLLRNEVRLGTIARNVGEVAELPAADDTAKERRALTHEELSRLLDAAEGPLAILIDLCGRNGLRPAEARATRWQDVHRDRLELDVSGQMNRHNERGPVKRATNAERTIGIDAATVDRLRPVCSDAVWSDDGEVGYLAVTEHGRAISREQFARWLNALCEDADLTPALTPYELRHTAISHQADAGRTSWEIADWAGTSEAMISARYRHRLRRVSPIRPTAGNNGPQPGRQSVDWGPMDTACANQDCPTGGPVRPTIASRRSGERIGPPYPVPPGEGDGPAYQPGVCEGCGREHVWDGNRWRLAS
jgi:integrase